MSTATSTKIDTIEQVVEALEQLAFRVERQNGVSASISLDQGERSFVVNFSIDDEGKVLKTTCRFAPLGDLVEDIENESELIVVLYSLLDLNTEILTFAAAVDGENDSESTPVVLTDSVPLGDLSTEEFESNVASLREALAAVSARIEIRG